MEIILKYFPGLSPLQQNQYFLLNEQVMYWNRHINLVSRKDIDQLPVHHILHSLGIALHASFSPEDEVLDVGTGGGFPGLPLAILFPHTRFTLIDSIGKKVRAVDEISRSLELPNVRCLQIRAENYTEKAHHIVSRAVTGLEKFTGWVGKNLISGSEITRSGIWYLKGGDLREELKPYPLARVFELKEDYSEDFFDSKKLVWLPSKSLK
jgi:16S rRNA (guanine527-N7)-methyltransferase